MAVFSYKAKKGPTDIKEGTIVADSVDAVVEKLNKEGYIPSFIKEGEIKTIGSKKFNFFPKKIKPKDINLFTNQLSNLLKSKVPLPRALGIIHEQTENPLLKKIIKEMLDNIKEGGNLSDTVARYPKHFSKMFINNIRSGEIGCVLEESLEGLAIFSEKEEALKMKIRIAIAYPLFMMFTGILTIIVLLTFVMPKLIGMFEDMGQKLPLPTQIVIGVSNGIRNYWYFLVTGIILIFINFKKRKISNTERRFLDRLKLKIPIMGKFLKEAEILRFARMVSLLLDNGLSLHKAIEVSVPTLNNVIIKNELKIASEKIIYGTSFSKSLQSSSLFPPFVISMLTVGEEGGRLSESLKDVADYYEREGEQGMKIMSSLLEPIMILAMGIIIGFIVIAMLLPIFELNVMTG